VAHRGFGATPATTAAAAIVQMMATGETRRCPACGGSADRELGEVNGFGIVRCGACGTLFTDRLPAEPEVKDYTDYYHAANLAVPAFVHARLREIVGEFATYRRTNRWLDVGCGARSRPLPRLPPSTPHPPQDSTCAWANSPHSGLRPASSMW
jgi:hypothetical protein